MSISFSRLVIVSVYDNSKFLSAGESDISSILGGMSHQDILRLFSGPSGAGLTGAIRGARPSSVQSQETPTPARAQSAPETQPAAESAGSTTPTARPFTAAPAASSAAPPAPESRAAAPSIQLSDLQNVLSNIQGRGYSFRQHLSYRNWICMYDVVCLLILLAPGAAAEVISLTEALNAEQMVPILADPTVQERLTQFLPQDASLPSSQEELHATISSPQFQQALNSFSSALASGQLGPALSQFGLGEAAIAAANEGGEFSDRLCSCSVFLCVMPSCVLYLGVLYLGVLYLGVLYLLVCYTFLCVIPSCVLYLGVFQIYKHL